LTNCLTNGRREADRRQAEVTRRRARVAAFSAACRCSAAADGLPDVLGETDAGLGHGEIGPIGARLDDLLDLVGEHGVGDDGAAEADYAT